MARNPGEQTLADRIVKLHNLVKRVEDDPEHAQRWAYMLADDMPETLQVMSEQEIDVVVWLRLARELRRFAERALEDPEADLRFALDVVRTLLVEGFPHSEEALADLPDELTAGSNVWLRGLARVAEVATLAPRRRA